MAAIAVAEIAAKGGHFDRAALILDGDQHHSELFTNREGLGKNADYLLRRGIGGDVIIGGLLAKQQIAHASANQIALEAALAQLAHDLDGLLFHAAFRMIRYYLIVAMRNGIHILGIESSCDETAAAVVRSGEQTESNVVLSQMAHAIYGGGGAGVALVG